MNVARTWMTCGECGTQFSSNAIAHTLCPGCKSKQPVPGRTSTTDKPHRLNLWLQAMAREQTVVDGGKLVMPRSQPADTNMTTAYCLTCKYRRGNHCVLLHNQSCFDANPRHDCQHWNPRRPIRDGLLMFAGAGLGAIGASIAWLIGIL